MSRIIRLDIATANQIAAGEVVERPASVVKELVENALDAEARRIVIQCHDAGKALIQVTDDGIGMSRSDAALCLERHTTSKLQAIEELEHLTTLGFRGEALPSIAAVARVEILTRPHQQLQAIGVTSEPGEQAQIRECPGPPGTSVTVRNLFFNVPARAKFLRSSAQELSQIVDTTTRLALSHPRVSFRLLHHNKVALSTSGSGVVKNALAEVWGADRVEGMLPIEWRSPEGVCIKGFAGSAEVATGSRRYQLSYVNGRTIRSGPLRFGVDNAYQGVLPSGRFAPVFLLVELPGSMVDINVHPAKWEARFWNDATIRAMVTEAVRDALGQPYRRFSPRVEHRGTGGWKDEPAFDVNSPAVTVQEPLFSPLLTQDQETETRWEWLGQAYHRYILGYDGQRLWAVDQHAAAERICYLKLSSSQRAVAQMLLEPEMVELGQEQAHVTDDEKLEVFRQLGFDVEVFGQRTLLVRAIPAPLSGVSVRQLVIDALERLSDHKGGWGPSEVRLALAACHGSLRAGQKLSQVEMHSLIRELLATDPPYVCPHGRPVMLELGDDEMDKKFGRSGR